MSLPRPLRHLACVSLAVLITAALLVAPARPAPPPAAAPLAAPAAAPGEVRGYVDLHSHLMAYEAFGGMLMCGKPFDPDGIQDALRDCPDHGFNGAFAWYENFVRHGSPFGTHDPTGWPTFKDWPAWDSRTHQQAHYTWLRRSWQAGQRILVNHLVANRQLCDLYPLKRNSCDEMDTVRLQAQRMRELEAHVDRENGGPGRGWLRIVRDPAQARRVIQDGKLAVVLGVEVSEPFGCREIAGEPQCTRADIDRGLDEMQRLGVSSMFVCHKFDNALCGVRFDGGTTGALVNTGNFLGTGRFWQVEKCTGAARDNTLIPAGGLGEDFRDVLRRLGLAGITLPLYPDPPHCNVRGLSDLGAHMVQGMIDRGMVVEVDHMSVKATAQTLDLLERAGHSGVVSSHSWIDGTFKGRVYALGGMITPYMSPAGSFAADWARDKKLRDPRYTFGYGYGLDVNGMGALPRPRGDAAERPLEYPFTSPIDPDRTFDRLRTGQRTWDLNTDGVANYGLVPDLIADTRAQAGPEFMADLLRGAEAYLQMWRRARTGTQAP